MGTVPLVPDLPDGGGSEGLMGVCRALSKGYRTDMSKRRVKKAGEQAVCWGIERWGCREQRGPEEQRWGMDSQECGERRGAKRGRGGPFQTKERQENQRQNGRKGSDWCRVG